MKKRNMASRLSYGILALAFSLASVQAQDRVRLLISTIETPDTRVDAMQKQVTLPVYEAPYSNADLQKLSGVELERAQRENANAARNYRETVGRTLFQEYQRRVKQQEEIANKAKNTAVGRNLIQARDWLAASLMDYGDLFDIILRVDDQEAQTEKWFAGMDALDIESSHFFVKAVVADPVQKSDPIRMPGGNTLTRTTTKQVVTIHVQDFKNKLIFTKMVEVVRTNGSSSVVGTTGDDDTLGDNLRQCFNKAAEEIAAHFAKKAPPKAVAVAEAAVPTASAVSLEIRLRGPKGDDGFDADDAIVSLNGREVFIDKPIPINAARGRQTVKVEMDGYETVEWTHDFSNEDGMVQKTLVLKKETAQGEE